MHFVAAECHNSFRAGLAEGSRAAAGQADLKAIERLGRDD